MITYPLFFFSSQGLIMYDGFDSYVLGLFDTQEEIWKYDYQFWNKLQPYQSFEEFVNLLNSILAETRPRQNVNDNSEDSILLISNNKSVCRLDKAVYSAQENSVCTITVIKAELYPHMNSIFTALENCLPLLSVSKSELYPHMNSIFTALENCLPLLSVSKSELYPYVNSIFITLENCLPLLSVSKSELYIDGSYFRSEDVGIKNNDIKKAKYLSAFPSFVNSELGLHNLQIIKAKYYASMSPFIDNESALQLFDIIRARYAPYYPDHLNFSEQIVNLLNFYSEYRSHSSCSSFLEQIFNLLNSSGKYYRLQNICTFSEQIANLLNFYAKYHSHLNYSSFLEQVVNLLNSSGRYYRLQNINTSSETCQLGITVEATYVATAPQNSGLNSDNSYLRVRFWGNNEEPSLMLLPFFDDPYVHPYKSNSKTLVYFNL